MVNFGQRGERKVEEERKREMGKKERAGVLNKIISDHSIILATTKVIAESIISNH